MKRSVTWFGVVGLLAGSLLPATLAFGAVQVVSGSLTEAPTDFTAKPLTTLVPQFDPALGTLTKVTVELQGTGFFTQAYENMSAGSVTPSFTYHILDLTLGLGGSSLTLNGSQNEAHSYTAAAYDGAFDFDGTSGATHYYPVTITGSQDLAVPADLALFLGLGTVPFVVTADGSQQQVLPGGNGSIYGLLSAGADVTVIYEFTVVPEAGTWIGAGLAGLGLLGSALRRRGVVG